MDETRIDDSLAQIADDGYCIIENVLSPEQADAIHGVIGHIDRQSPMAMFDATNTHSLTSGFPPSAKE